MSKDDIRAKMAAAVRWAVLGTLAELAALEIAARRGRGADRPAGEEAGLYDLTFREREWAEKAVRRYAEAQRKQWQNYNEAMFEKE